jgi:hypothetical protein
MYIFSNNFYGGLNMKYLYLPIILASFLNASHGMMPEEDLQNSSKNPEAFSNQKTCSVTFKALGRNHCWKIEAYQGDTVQQLRNKLFQKVQESRVDGTPPTGFNDILEYGNVRLVFRGKDLLWISPDSTLLKLGICGGEVRYVYQCSEREVMTSILVQKRPGSPKDSRGNIVPFHTTVGEDLHDYWKDYKIYANPEIVDGVTKALDNSTIRSAISSGQDETALDYIRREYGQETWIYFKKMLDEAKKYRRKS